MKISWRPGAGDARPARQMSDAPLYGAVPSCALCAIRVYGGAQTPINFE